MPSDVRLLARALAELSAARKTILMYPAGHNQIRPGIQRTPGPGSIGTGDRRRKVRAVDPARRLHCHSCKRFRRFGR